MKINIFSIPSNAGALYKGTELAPEVLLKRNLVGKLEERGLQVQNMGDIGDFSNLPRHNVEPIRNWPAPRMVWDAILEKSDEIFDPDFFSIILGGDCSIEVGTFTAFQKVFGDKSHLLVLDAHIDSIEPNGDRCVGAAGMGLWFLTQDRKVWRKEEPVNASDVSIIGPNSNTQNHYGFKVVPILEHTNMEPVIALLHEMSPDAKILVHFDVDLLDQSIMPSAYSPNMTGLSFQHAKELLSIILSDPRVKGMEVTEFAANKENDGTSANTIVDLLCCISKREE
ncbi:arginase family protein [Neobacillus sp. LXY-1]|uniref:arginase family protein n=1 Tax=Neobacillus sp. LXY-1 TaxID=3379133 RepID=UPI003EDFE3EA